MDMAKGLPEKPDNCLGTYGARTYEEVLVRVWGIFPHFQYIVLSAFVAKIEDFAHSFYILKSTERQYLYWKFQKTSTTTATQKQCNLFYSSFPSALSHSS